jgi:nucleoside-diphosphate-sugar epimerase
MTHNSDFAVGFVGLMGNIHTLGHAFHITSDEVLTWDQIYDLIGSAAGVKPKKVHVSSETIAAFAPDELGNLIGDKAQCGIFDNAKIKSFVPGFAAKVPFSEGVRESLKWFEAHPERRTIDANFNATCDRMLVALDSVLAAAHG